MADRSLNLRLWLSSADRELRIHHGVDHNGAAHCGGVELTSGPARPFGIICCNVEEYIRVDQRHQLSPRVSAMIASVVSPQAAVPRIRSKRLGLTVRLPTLRRKAQPSSATSKSTLLPGLIPRRSRTCFGTVTWPLLVTVTVINASSVIPKRYWYYLHPFARRPTALGSVLVTRVSSVPFLAGLTDTLGSRPRPPRTTSGNSIQFVRAERMSLKPQRTRGASRIQPDLLPPP
jgi:hypothetical protein